MPSKKFALIGHRVPSHGKLNLNDLAGSCGRLDVLLRSVNTSLFLSHGIREDVEVILHLQGGEKPPRRIWIDGSKAKGVHSDERSIAGHLSKILQKPLPPIGTKKEISNNLNTRKTGSAALDLAYVGAGRYDGYFQNNLNIWDIAAGIIIVKEAGGKINDLSYLSNEDIQVFAGSNAIYEKMLENLNNF